MADASKFLTPAMREIMPSTVRDLAAVAKSDQSTMLKRLKRMRVAGLVHVHERKLVGFHYAAFWAAGPAPKGHPEFVGRTLREAPADDDPELERQLRRARERTLASCGRRDPVVVAMFGEAA